MRFVLGFASGVAAAWAALAIWQRVPPIGPIDAVDEDVWEPRRGDRRPGFEDSVAGDGSLAAIMPIGARRIPPEVHLDDCGYPSRPCVCGTFVEMHGGFGSP